MRTLSSTAGLAGVSAHWKMWMVCAAALLAGCPEIPASASDPQIALEPVTVGSHLVLAEVLEPALFVASVADGRLQSVERHALGGAPSELTALPDDDTVLALSPEAETLTRLTVSDGAAVTYPLGAPFDALSVAPDGDVAMAWFRPDSKASVFANTNELALVDLDPVVAPQDAVIRRTLASLGGTPTRFVVSPQVGSKRYAFVLSESHVAIVDLLNPQAVERSVPLVSLEGGASRTPVDVTFGVDPDEQTLWGVVTTLQGNAAYALRITPAPNSDAGFDVVLNQLAGLAPGGDVALMTLPDGRLTALLVNPTLGTATLTELHTGDSRVITPGGGIQVIRAYEEDGRPMAVLYRPQSTTFHVLDVAEIEAKKEKAYRTRHAAQPIAELLPVPGTSKFVAIHPNATDAVSVIHADTDRITPFGRTGQILEVHLALDLGQLFLLTRLADATYVVSVDLATLHPEASVAPAGGDSMRVLSDASTVAVYSALPGGRLDLWPTFDTRDDASQAVPGILLHGALDGAGEER